MRLARAEMTWMGPAVQASAHAEAFALLVAEAGAPAPQQAIDSVKADVAEIKEAVHR